MPFAIRIDAATLPALIFGGLLVVVAVVLFFFVWRARRALQPVVEYDDDARLHADRQFRRRTQVSVMLAIVGILIPLGDQLDKIFIQFPFLFLAWLIAVFFFVLWIVLMALGDWLSTAAYSSIARARLRHERTELEDEIRRYHASKNGHSLDEGQDSYSSGTSP